MTHRASALLLMCAGLAVGCKSSKPSAKDAIVGGGDDAPSDTTIPPGDASIDAPVLPACAAPVSGTKISFRKLPQKVRILATLATAPRGDARLFVTDWLGGIWIYKDEVLQAQPFMDLSLDAGGPVTASSECGLLGLAFHPDYANNKRFFLYYSTGDLGAGTLRQVVVRCQTSATDPDKGDPASCVEILSMADDGPNHNGGMIEFGNDGYLYIGTGDGGGPDQLLRSQNLMELRGKMLRIDVDHETADTKYTIPADNPFVAGGGKPEIWMYGLRNPWRWTFDRPTGDMWIGEVGRSDYEELDVLSPAEQKGANLGWSMYEGTKCFQGPCDPTGKVFPKDQRERTATGWAAIVGGQVYRGTCYPDLVGWAVYADDQVSKYVRARLKSDRSLEIVDLTEPNLPVRPISFHEDARGEIYMTDASGFVYHLEASP